MKDLKNSIFNIKLRETSGSSSSNRFDFQKDWAICKILELHEIQEDYLISFEFHDDIIIFDSASDPQKISFYQIKTDKAAHWTLKKLVSRKKSKSGELLSSYLGNLFEHIKNFGDSVHSLNFVTNNRIKAKLQNEIKCEDLNEFCCDDLCSNDLNLILEELKKEHSLNDLKNFSKITFFKLGELSINDHSTIVKGKLSEFIDKILPNTKYQIAPLYKSIFDEIKMKTNYELSVSDFDNLKKFKSISREDFSNYINQIKNNDRLDDKAKTIEDRLNSEKVNIAFIRKFRTTSKIYELKKMNYNDKGFRKIETEIKKTIEKEEDKLTGNLIESLDIIFRSLSIDEIKQYAIIDDDLIKTTILFCLYE